MGLDRSETVGLMELSAMLYIYTYCVFTLYGRTVNVNIMFYNVGEVAVRWMIFSEATFLTFLFF